MSASTQNMYFIPKHAYDYHINIKVQMMIVRLYNTFDLQVGCFSLCISRSTQILFNYFSLQTIYNYFSNYRANGVIDLINHISEKKGMKIEII